MNTYNSYAKFVKPSWSPPAYLFGPVWTFLYIIIAISFGYVFWSIIIGNLPTTIAMPFVLNLFFNSIFTYLQFKLKNNFLASIDILLVWVTIVWIIFSIYNFSPLVAYAQIPYLLWVSFASVLQLTITYLNLE